MSAVQYIPSCWKVIEDGEILSPFFPWMCLTKRYLKGVANQRETLLFGGRNMGIIIIVPGYEL